MKKKAIVITVFLLVICIITGGVFLYFKNKDNISGCFFRKMYGSIGIVNDASYSIRIDMFCFDSDVDFLNDIEKLSFDNSEVAIMDVSYEEQSREEDLVVYAVNFSVSVSDNGIYDIRSLNYSGENGTETYPVGEISFVCQNENPTYLKHGCDSSIYDGKATFHFSGANETAFMIKDIILADKEDVSYSYEKNVSFTPGEEVIYEIKADYSISKGDMFVMHPVFVIEYEGDDNTYYFTPMLLVCDEENLTYPEIKEYAKNDFN